MYVHMHKYKSKNTNFASKLVHFTSYSYNS